MGWCITNTLMFVSQHIWHGKSDEVSGSKDDPQYYNFYECFVKDSWLYKGLIDPARPLNSNDQARAMTYFERMSEAMARMCSGRVYVLTLNPLNLQKYGRIWGDIELPTLRSRVSEGGGTAQTQLIAIDALTHKT